MKKKLLMGLILCLMIFNVACSKGNKDDNNKDTSQEESQIESTTKDNLTESTSKEENNSQNLETSKEDKKVTLQDSEIKEGEEVAIIKTSMGDIKVRFFKEQAPKAVENFITHAKNGYYNGVKFHRVINEFMIQSGDPLGNGTGGESIWGEPFENEIDLQLRHFNGALSMANTGMPNSNGSQFFIVQNSKIQEEALVNELKSFIDNQEQELQEGLKVKDVFPVEVCEKYLKDGGSPLLDGGYTVFGQVYEGMDIVNKIAAVEVKDNGNNEKSLPVEDIIIEKVEVFEYKK